MGASTNPFSLLQSIGGALLVLVVVVVVGWFAIVRLRNWMRSGAESSEPFTLEDLRKLHREGQLSDEEFERAKTMMIGSVRRAPSLKELKAAQGTQARETPPTTPLADQLRKSPPVRPAQLGRPRGDDEAPPPTGTSDGDPRPPKSPKRPPQLG